jgi:hypothetical protein
MDDIDPLDGIAVGPTDGHIGFPVEGIVEGASESVIVGKQRFDGCPVIPHVGFEGGADQFQRLGHRQTPFYL